MKRLLRVLLILVASLLVLLLAAELAASFTRAGNAVVFTSDPDLYVVRKPGQSGYTLGYGIWNECRINAQGLRGEDLPEPRPAGERWVLCLGDSFTFGGGVDDHEAWPAQLQALLGPPPQSGLRVLNGGANGWDTPWQRRYLERRALDQLHPDVVVLGWNWNDLSVDPSGDTGAKYAAQFLEMKGTWLSLFASLPLLRESHLFRWLYTQEKGGFDPLPDEVLRKRFVEYARLVRSLGIEPEQRCAEARQRRFGNGPPDLDFWKATDTPGWKVVRAEMERLRDLCAAHGATFAVALFPEPTWDGPGTFPGTERMAALLDGLGVPWVDVQPSFLRDPAQGGQANRRAELWQRLDPVHPVPQGHRIFAEQVLGLLRARGLVPAGG